MRRETQHVVKILRPRRVAAVLLDLDSCPCPVADPPARWCGDVLGGCIGPDRHVSADRCGKLPVMVAYVRRCAGGGAEGRVRAGVDRRQELTVQRDALARLGVPADRVYTDHGLTGTNRARPGLEQALAAVRAKDLFVVT